MNFKIQKLKENNFYKILVKNNMKVVCEYCMEVTDNVTYIGERMIYTTLCGWTILDFCLSGNLNVEIDFTEFELEYLNKLYSFCCRLYETNFNLKISNLNFLGDCLFMNCPRMIMEDSYYLGYTGGKDSTLTKILLNDLNKKIEYYKVSYDDDITLGCGRIFNTIFDSNLYYSNTITGYKNNSNLVSFHQSDDIHVTFVAPYIYKKNIYPSNLAVGLPYDAIHSFLGEIPDLVPTETFKSLEFLEQLMHNYGFLEYKIVSPIGSLHTFGVYNLLSKIIGIDNLLKLDSCWENPHGNNPCGMCPKCQRLKYIFKTCFNSDYVSNIPLLNITSSDFLFGSIHAKKLIEHVPTEDIKSSQIIHNDVQLDQEFLDLLENKYNYKKIYVDNIEFEQDAQCWDQLLDEIVYRIGVDYRELSDDAINSDEVDYLPFEKYYNWGRKNKVLNCYDLKHGYRKKVKPRKNCGK